jgi:hypothetical protein
LVLTGCSTAPTTISMQWPNASATLMTACPDLVQTPPTEKLSEVLPVIVDNYSTYYVCQTKVNSWIEWYNSQKKISDSLQ